MASETDSAVALEAVRAHMQCVYENVIKIDDGKADPHQLARAIQPLCHSQHEAAMRASFPGEGRATLEVLAQGVEFDHTLAAVLYARHREMSGQ